MRGAIRKRVMRWDALRGGMWFPTADELIAAHDEIIAGTGGERGLRERAAVVSAVERAEWGPFEGSADLAERAALLLRGVVLDHPFVDGNKRAAFAAASILVEGNGHEIDVDLDSAVTFMLRCARGELEVDEIAEWFRSRLRRL